MRRNIKAFAILIGLLFIIIIVSHIIINYPNIALGGILFFILIVSFFAIKESFTS